MYIVVWGFPNAFPMFQTYLSTGKAPRHPNSAILAFLAPGIQDIEEGIMFQFLPYFAQHTRLLVSAGITIILTSLFLASSATAAWQIVLSQGVLFGIGGILLNFVHVTALTTWFDKKQSQAMGMVWSGWRLGALVFPLLCQWLLQAHGFTTTLRILIAPMFALLSPSFFLLRGRYPAVAVISQRARPPVSKLSLFRDVNILYHLVVSTVFGMIAYVPQIFITRFAADMGLSVSDQAISYSLLVVSLMAGTYLFAKISDVGFHPRLVAGEAFITSAVHLLLLGFCKDRVMLFTYAVAIGLSSGGFSNSFFAFFTEVSQRNGELYTAVHSLFSFFRGIASLSVGSIGIALIQVSSPLDVKDFGIGKYKYLILYAGGMSFLSGFLMLIQPIFKRSR